MQPQTFNRSLPQLVAVSILRSCSVKRILIQKSKAFLGNKKCCRYGRFARINVIGINKRTCKRNIIFLSIPNKFRVRKYSRFALESEDDTSGFYCRNILVFRNSAYKGANCLGTIVREHLSSGTIFRGAIVQGAIARIPFG